MAAAKKALVLRFLMSPEVFTIAKACALADVAPQAFYTWKKDDENFAAAVLEAEEIQTQHLEQRAGERAMGLNVKQPSDMLMMFLLNGRRPEKYRQHSKVEHSGSLSLHDLVLDDKPAVKK